MTDEKLRYVRQWLEKAEEDLKGYKIFMNDEDPLYSLAGFHLQQAAEKFLKAFLEYNAIIFPKTHDVELLLKQCALVESSFADIKFDNISDFAVDLRYPGDMQPPSKNELEQAYESVQEIKQLVLSFLKF